jgi:dTDP-4-amino-4,6-dideoxygalactose transaminase
MVKKISVSDPGAVIKPYKTEILEVINKTVESGCYIGGPEVELFEREFSGYLNVKYSLGTGSGTDALQLAFRALGITNGDKVATVSHTAVATVAAIELVGAVPVFVDIDPDTFTINTESLQQTLEFHRATTPSAPIKAVVPVHLYGHPADMPEIMRISEQYNALVVEDCAQAHGAAIHGRKCGTWGHAAAFSFYPTKNLGCLGDGGALCTNSDSVYESAKMVKEYGWKERYISIMPGINTRLDAVQAAVLRIKLRYLDKENSRRIYFAGKYNKGLNSRACACPKVTEGYTHVYHQYVIKTRERNELIRILKQSGICTSILYPQPVHMQPAYTGRIPIKRDLLRITEQICGEIVCLPVHPALSEEDVNYIIDTINNSFLVLNNKNERK